MDRITLTGIEAWGHHGVLEHERELGQRFVVDVEVAADLAGAAASDRLADTIDYAGLAQRVADLVAGRSFRLIEGLAVRIAEVVLEDERVLEATVTVHKPSAPFPVVVAEAAVTVVRRR